MFLVPKFFGGSAPECLDLRYKIQPFSDHVAKFHDDRPRELGDMVGKIKKISRAKYKTSRTTVWAA